MIRRIYIHNFRCLENFELSLLDASSVLLLGKNGAGKTTVGAVLEVLQKVAHGINRVGQLVRPRDLTNERVGVPMRFEVEADLNGQTYLYSIAFEFPSLFRELRVLDEKLLVDGQPVYSRDLAEVRIVRASAATGATFRLDWHLVALPLIQEQSAQDPIAVFKSWLRNALILRPVPSLFLGISDGEVNGPSVLDAQAVNIATWFTAMMATSPDIYSNISEYLQQVMPGFEKIITQLIGRNSRNLLLHFMRGPERLVLELDQLSDGERCFVLYSLVIAAGMARQPLLCFWDEPDNFLAPDEVGLSIMGLRRAFQDSGQLVITSHNPEVIRRFSDENTFYLSRRSRLEPTTHKTVRAMRESGEYAGSFIDALLRGEIGDGAES